MIWRALLTIALLSTGVPVSLAGASFAPSSETEEHLLARIQKETDPIKKSKGVTRLARIKLEQAIQAYGHGNIEQGAQLVSVYLGRIKDSWKILRSSGRNAARSPQGFKELDIELREDVRLLDDLKRRVSYFDRGPLEQTGKDLEQVRTEVLQALFPAARTPEATKPLGKTD
jgi:hypothetical protein